MNLKEQFIAALPGVFFLEKDIPTLSEFLQDLQFISKEEIIDISKPGEGNMNVVYRVKTNLRSFIVKQSRPYVQKYPQIVAPVERIQVEALYFSIGTRYG